MFREIGTSRAFEAGRQLIKVGAGETSSVPANANSSSWSSSSYGFHVLILQHNGTVMSRRTAAIWAVSTACLRYIAKSLIAEA